MLNPFSKALIGAQWLFFKTGLGATNHFEAAAFVRSRAGVDYPDIQYHFIPAAVRYDGKAAAKSHGFQAHVGPMRSKSRGSVTLRSPDPKAKPVIRFNYMSHPDDWTEFRHCIRLTREIFGQKAFDDYRGKEISPGSHVQTDDELDVFIRDHAESAYHPCGTCKMGRADDPMSVVDPECRVIGVDGLARRRFLDLPARHQRQPQRAVDHDRREGRRPHSRPHAAGAVQPGAMDQSALAGVRQIEHDPANVARPSEDDFGDLPCAPSPRHRTMSTARYIDDEQGAPLPVIYPATGETIAMLRSATPNVLELAVEAARPRSLPGRG